jgi:hypothetical protein
MIIAVHNFKGGIGSTTIALHLAYLAQKAGHKVGGASVDFKKDLERFLAPIGIPCVDPTTRAASSTTSSWTSVSHRDAVRSRRHRRPDHRADLGERALELSDRTRDQVLW